MFEEKSEGLSGNVDVCVAGVEALKTRRGQAETRE